MPKICLRICIFADERSIHTRRWVTGLRSLGHDISLITLRKDHAYDIGGVDLEASRKLRYLAMIPTLRKIVKRLNPDIFHAHFASSFGFLASFVRHPRKVVSAWGNDIVMFPRKSPFHEYMIRRALSSPTLITVTSNFLRDVAFNYAGAQGRIEVVPFGIGEDFVPKGVTAPCGPLRIGFTKGPIPMYGLEILIRAFKIVIETGNDARLLITGKKVQEQRYVDLINMLGINKLVQFMGFIQYPEMPTFLSSLDIFVMPSTCAEAFGVAALEASATGLPVVATRVGGVPEVVIDGESGILVERGNVEQLAKAIIELVRRPELRQRMGQAGRKLVESKYRWTDNLRKMSDLYYQLMS